MLHKLTIHRCMCYEHSFDQRSYSILVATTSESQLNSRSVVVDLSKSSDYHVAGRAAELLQLLPRSTSRR